MMLTLEDFNKIPHETVFSKGEISDSPEGINMTNSGNQLKWLAKKGYGNDWVIYFHWAWSGYNFIETNGDKVHNEENILKLVCCDKQVLNLYRR